MRKSLHCSTLFLPHSVREKNSNQPYRCEIFGVYPATRKRYGVCQNSLYHLADCYRVEMYNYGLNSTAVAIADIKQQKVLANGFPAQTQPDIPLYLKNLAIKIAVSSPAVQQALGIKPEEKEALMASTKTSLNRTRCERSGHLMCSPYFC